MTYRLQYLAHMMELSEAPFTIGRNSSCQLTIESDSLISRRHATFRVTPAGVTVQDHDSRNGVIVNGARIEHEALLEAGDTILIGVQELTLVSDKPTRARAGARAGSPASKHLAATGIHRAITLADESIPVHVDYVIIGGHSYAVVPKAEYLRMRKKLAAAEPAPPPAATMPPPARRSRLKKK